MECPKDLDAFSNSRIPRGSTKGIIGIPGDFKKWIIPTLEKTLGIPKGDRDSRDNRDP